MPSTTIMVISMKHFLSSYKNESLAVTVPYFVVGRGAAVRNCTFRRQIRDVITTCIMGET